MADAWNEILTAVDALRAAVVKAQAAATIPPPTSEPAAALQLLDPETTAQRLGVRKKWLYEHADDLPFTRRLSSRKLRFDEAGIIRWLDHRRGGRT